MRNFLVNSLIWIIKLLGRDLNVEIHKSEKRIRELEAEKERAWSRHSAAVTRATAWEDITRFLVNKKREKVLGRDGELYTIPYFDLRLVWLAYQVARKHTLHSDELWLMLERAIRRKSCPRRVKNS